MQNYRIYFGDGERSEVVRILRSHHDIIIDNIDDNSVGITIERDDDGASYRSLMDEIDREIFSLRSESGI
ncbi:hypothetical protein [Chryseosolibacter indicus]|uniref:DUF4911 domain-containing protein n=1 Tax=Chryseosolibacter indicus TaxID=2782351 RepID=A0ABS5VKG1_9BACT|nr:hypothetical protein [Chryseosolibacter indicus]MBT1701927.1 hypothetical protein [Chryseosolibacter indicus]